MARFGSIRPPAADLLLFTAVGLAYSAGSLVAYSWFGASVSPTFFPSAGVTVGALVLVGGRRRRALVLAAAATAEICVNVFHGGMDVAPAAGYALANVSEATLAAFLVVAIARGAPLVERRGLAGLVVGVLVAPWLGGSIAAAVTALDAGDLDTASYIVHWWLGDALGILLVGGGLIAAATEERRHGRFDGELAAFVLAGAAAAGAALWWDVWPAGYVPFVLTLVAAWRVGALGALATAGVAATVVAEAAANAESIFDPTGIGPDVALVYAQVAIGVVVGTALVFVVLLHENAESRAEHAASEARAHELANEQAALRRVATLVADEAAPDVIFASVAEEIAGILTADRCAIGRFEEDDSMTVVGYWSNEEPKLPVGTRIDLQGDGVTAAVRESRRPILIDDHEAFSGPLIEYARTLGSLPNSTVAAPIFVEGCVWGSIFASTMAAEITEGTESRVVDFAELIATAIANTETRRELERVAAEQRALRRAATLVASGAPTVDVFAAITTLASELFEVPFASLLRYGPDETATMVAGCAACSGFVGQSWTVPGDDPGIVRTVVESRRPARIEDHSGVHGPLGEAARSLGIGSVVGVPVIVDGGVWGVLAVGAAQDGPSLPADAGDRLVGFTELVTTTLINAETRNSLRRLADEQAALRRVATLAAAGIEPDELFSAVSEEVARLFAVDGAGVGRFEPDGSEVVVVGRSESLRSIPVGSRQNIDESFIAGEVNRTGRAVRVDLRPDDVVDAGAYGELAKRVLAMGFLSTVGAPIVVEGELWGVVTASSSHTTLPPNTEKRIESFGELVATAIASVGSRAELAASEARARALANEQAALRRVATLVAQGASPDELFSAVAHEVAGIIDIPVVGVSRYEADGTFTILAVAGETNFTVGSRWPVDEDGIAGMILATGRPSRTDDYSRMPGRLGAAIREDQMASTLGIPIVVEGSIWGFMIAAAKPGRPIPADTEERLARFTELIATAVSKATTRSDLIASRARIVAAGDEARRRIERNLHDGTQQRLIALGLDVETVRDSIPADQQEAQSGLERITQELEAVLEDVRELSQGLHPALLSQAGLGASLRALARRSPIPVRLDARVSERPSESTETAVYYVISEALANAAKHARASEIAVVVTTSKSEIRALIEDDGDGGAEVSAGSGLVGLIDRIEALGGRFALDSPPGHGTRISIEMPLTAEPIGDVVRVPGGRRATPDDGPAPPIELLQPADADAVHAAVAASADALYVVDPRGRIRFLNRAALRILDYEDERQLLGRPSHDTIHYLRHDGTSYPAAECPLLRPRLSGETVRVNDDWFVRQDGSLVPVAYSSAPVPLAEGRGAVVSFRERPAQEGVG